MPSWVKLKEGYCYAAEPGAVSIFCFDQDPEDITFQITLSTVNSGDRLRSYVYVDKNKFIIDEKHVRSESPDAGKRFEFAALCPNKMLTLAKQNGLFVVSEEDKAIILREKSYQRFSHKIPTPASFEKKIVGFFSFFILLVRILQCGQIGLLLAAFFLVYSQIRESMRFKKNRATDQPYTKLLRVLEVGGIEHLDPSRCTESPANHLLEKSMKPYIGLIIMHVFFSCMEYRLFFHSLLLCVYILFVNVYLKELGDSHVFGAKIYENTRLALSPKGVLNFISRTSHYESTRRIQSDVYASFFNSKFGINKKHAVLTVSWGSGMHLSLFIEDYVGGNGLQCHKYDYRYLSQSSAGSAGSLGEKVRGAWGGLSAYWETAVMVATNRQVRALITGEKKNNLQKKEGCKTRSVVVSDKICRQLLRNMSMLKKNAKYRIRDSNCLVQTFRLLDTVGALPLDLRQEINKFLPSFSVRFKSSDNYGDYQLKACNKLFLS